MSPLGSTLSATSGVINIGGIPFLHGYAKGNQNVFVGGAGNFITTGTATAATGFGALAAQTTGSFNTASGLDALFQNTTGSHTLPTVTRRCFPTRPAATTPPAAAMRLRTTSPAASTPQSAYLAGPPVRYPA